MERKLYTYKLYSINTKELHSFHYYMIVMLLLLLNDL
jgi:hypothetical protein